MGGKAKWDVCFRVTGGTGQSLLDELKNRLRGMDNTRIVVQVAQGPHPEMVERRPIDGCPWPMPGVPKRWQIQHPVTDCSEFITVGVVSDESVCVDGEVIPLTIANALTYFSRLGWKVVTTVHEEVVMSRPLRSS